MAMKKYDKLMEENAILQKKLDDIRCVLEEKVESKNGKEPLFKLGYIEAIVFSKKELAELKVGNTFTSQDIEIDWSVPRLEVLRPYEYQGGEK